MTFNIKTEYKTQFKNINFFFLPDVTSSNKTPSAQRSAANASCIDNWLLSPTTIARTSLLLLRLLLSPIRSPKGVDCEEERRRSRVGEIGFGAEVDESEFALLPLDNDVDNIVVVVVDPKTFCDDAMWRGDDGGDDVTGEGGEVDRPGADLDEETLELNTFEIGRLIIMDT